MKNDLPSADKIVLFNKYEFLSIRQSSVTLVFDREFAERFPRR